MGSQPALQGEPGNRYVNLQLSVESPKVNLPFKRTSTVQYCQLNASQKRKIKKQPPPTHTVFPLCYVVVVVSPPPPGTRRSMSELRWQLLPPSLGLACPPGWPPSSPAPSGSAARKAPGGGRLACWTACVDFFVLPLCLGEC